MAKRRKKRAAPARKKPAPRRAPVRRRKRRLRRDGRGRLRDYRKEYRRRVKIAQLRDLEQDVARDARRVFGTKPYRTDGDDDGPHYELRLAELAEKEGRFDWLDEAAFIAQAMSRGATKHEAYTLWFSP